MTFPESPTIQELAAALVAALTEAGVAFTPEDPQKLFTPDELAVMFGRTRSTIYKLSKAHHWPHKKIGGAILFDREDIAKIIAMNQQTPTPPRRTRSRLK